MFLARTWDRAANLLMQLRNRHFFILDLILFFVLPYAALWLRTDNAFSDGRYLSDILIYAVATVPLWMLVLWQSKLYTRNWQYASFVELASILVAVALATIASTIVYLLLLRPLNLISSELPRTLPVAVALLSVIAIVATRYSFRFVEHLRRQKQFAGQPHKQVVVFGAGGPGVLIVREMQENPELGLYPIGFLDEDTRKHKTMILGLPVIGGRDALPLVAQEYHADEVIIALPTAPGKTIREITTRCIENHLPYRTMPAMSELLNGTFTATRLREVMIDDLLRREPIETDTQAIAELLHNKRVLVTGAGGSIGSEICRQVARFAPAQLILMGHGENSLFLIGNELQGLYPEMQIESVVADVRAKRRVFSIVKRFQPDLIFHAAAHKHVTLMETNIEDAVTNNVLGTRVMVDAALANGVNTFVMISTDKAVNPVSIMGATKRVAELYVYAKAQETGRRYVVVRFGNVLGSRGSVVPLFKQQIAKGGPVLVTHPEVRRFFMTIPEAVQLVLQAAALGIGREIFALDMGEPVRIVELAQDLIRLSGLRVGQDIEIEFTGLRPGEKMYEEVFVPGEQYERTRHEKILVARNGEHRSEHEFAALEAAIQDLIVAALDGNEQLTRERLERILPEFRHRRTEMS